MNRLRTKYATYFSDYTPPSLCFSDSGGDANGGVGNGSSTTATPDTTTTTAPAAPNWTEFAQSLERLNDNLGGKLDAQLDTVRQMATATPPAQIEEPVDLESLSRPELVSHIVGTISRTVRDMIAEALNPLTSEVNDIRQSVVTKTVSEEMSSLKSANKDFEDWRPDMIALAKQPQYATLGVTDLYQLAKAKNPAKSAELSTKYNPPAPPPRPRFGGLGPTGAPGANGSASNVLSARDAGIEAYREVQARNPGILAALENF